MEATHPPSTPDQPVRSTSIAIAQLNPELDRLAESSINAVVTLVWPYSSSTRTLSLLVAEPDFRLRRVNGQVKVTFHGSVAEKVAQTHVGIGDEVLLRLDGSRWVESEVAKRTPGRNLAWDIHFDDRVYLEISRASNPFATVKIDRPKSPPQITEDSTAPPSTPAPVDKHQNGAGLGSWDSPAFHRSLHTSFGVLADSAFDPFAEEDGFVPGKGRKRPRFSLRSNEWRVVDEAESPRDKEIVLDWTEAFDEDGDEDHDLDANAENISDRADRDVIMDQSEAPVSEQATEVEDEAIARSPAPVEHTETIVEAILDQSAEPTIPASSTDAPQIKVAAEQAGAHLAFDYVPHLPTDTPRLHPIPSPGLPIPSPIVTSSNGPLGYFTSAFNQRQGPSQLSMSMEADTEETTTGQIGLSQLQRETLQPQEAGGNALDSEAVDEPTRLIEPISQVPDADSISQTPVQTIASEVHESTFTESNQLEVQVERALDIETEKTVETSRTEVEGLEENVVEVMDEEVEDDERIHDTLQQKLEEDEEEDFQEDEVEQALEEKEDEGSLTLREDVGLQEKDAEEEDVEEDEEDEDEDEEREVIDVDGDDQGLPEQEILSEVEAGKVMVNPAERARENIIFDKSQQDLRAEVDEDDAEVVEEPVEYSDSEVEGEMDYADTSPAREPYNALEQGRDRGYAKGDDGEDEEDDEEDDEALYDDEDMEDEYESEHVYDDEFEANVESEMDSEGADEEEAYHRPPPKTVHPEVIVLDSDSEEEPPSKPLAQPVLQRKQEITSPRESESPQESADEYSMSEDRHSNPEEAEDSSDENEDEDEDEGPPMHEVDVQMEDDTAADADIEEALSIDKDEEPRDAMSSLQHAAQLLDAGMQTPVPRLYPEPPIDLASAAVDVAESAIDSSLRLNQESLEEAYVESEHAAESGDECVLVSLGKVPTLSEAPLDPRLLYDGAASSQAESPVDGARRYPIPMLQNHQALFTPDASQEVAANHQFDRQHTVAEGPLTPQDTQVSQHPTLESEDQLTSIVKTEPVARVLPTQDIVPSTEADIVEPSLRSDPDERLEIEGKHEDDDQVLNEDEALRVEVTLHDSSPEAPETPTDDIHEGPDRYASGLRSKLSYFAPLATLVDHFHSLTDTISIVHEVSPVIHATSGKKDHIVTVQLTDPSMAGTTLSAQILRPYKSALPSLAEGDAVLLRNFHVKSFNHSMMLVSVDSSAWAVFDGSSEEPHMTGPPVEYGAEELAYVTGLRKWYQEDGASMVADYQLQASIARADVEETPASSSAAPSEAGSIDDSTSRGIRGDSATSNRSSRRSRKSHRRITIHELRDGTRYVEVGSPNHDRDSIHELRDGTAYAHL